MGQWVNGYLLAVILLMSACKSDPVWTLDYSYEDGTHDSFSLIVHSTGAYVAG